MTTALHNTYLFQWDIYGSDLKDVAAQEVHPSYCGSGVLEMSGNLFSPTYKYF